MTGQNHLMSNTYVSAYQAEIRDELESARRGDTRLRAVYERTAAWAVKTMARATGIHRSEAASLRLRSFDRSSATGACEIDDGLAL